MSKRYLVFYKVKSVSIRNKGPQSSLIFAVGAVLILSILSGCEALDASGVKDRIAIMERSPEWRDNRFQNVQPIYSDLPRALMQGVSSVPDDKPVMPIPVVVTDPADLARFPVSGLRVTWFGHSSTLLEIDGVRVLTDPIWSDRASPVDWIGPRRWYSPTITLSELPRIDAVLISHDHYDHLDKATVLAMRDWVNLFIVPLGIGARLEQWGIPRQRVVELDWWQSTRLGVLNVSLVPARHSSGRLDPRSDHTLWGGFALVGPHHRLYFSGDTGMQDAMIEIGNRYGPFDLALIEAGQYSAAWPDAHLGPEQAVLTAKQVNARTLLPVHWGLFKLAPHGWTEPVERVIAASRCTNLTVITPRPGQSVEPTALSSKDLEHWWPQSKMVTVKENPIISTVDGVPTHRLAQTICAKI